MKQLYTSVITLVGIFAFGQEVEVRWQKDIKSVSQDFLSQLTKVEKSTCLSKCVQRKAKIGLVINRKV